MWPLRPTEQSQPADPGEVDVTFDEEVDDEDITANDVDDLFARLRSQNDEIVDDDEGGATDTGGGQPYLPAPFAGRDEALTPLIVSCGRKLKRVLADEQNDVLDRLRAKQAVRSIDALLAGVDEQVSREFGVITVDLSGAATAARSRGRPATPPQVRRRCPGRGPGNARRRSGPAVARPACRRDRGRRRRQRRAHQAGAGDLPGWKTKRIDDELDNVLRQAYGRGALGAAATGTPIRWASTRRSVPARIARTTACRARSGGHGVSHRTRLRPGPHRLPLRDRPRRLNGPAKRSSVEVPTTRAESWSMCLRLPDAVHDEARSLERSPPLRSLG